MFIILDPDAQGSHHLFLLLPSFSVVWMYMKTKIYRIFMWGLPLEPIIWFMIGG